MLVDPPPNLRGHPRIALHAVTGSGTSTLAARLAALTGAPHVSVATREVVLPRTGRRLRTLEHAHRFKPPTTQ